MVLGTSVLLLLEFEAGGMVVVVTRVGVDADFGFREVRKALARPAPAAALATPTSARVLRGMLVWWN